MKSTTTANNAVVEHYQQRNFSLSNKFMHVYAYIFSVWFLFVYDHFNRYERKQLHELFGHDLSMFIRHRCRRIQRYWSVNQRISP